MQQRIGHGFSANNRTQESLVAIKAEQNPPNAGENIVGGNHCGFRSLKTKSMFLLFPARVSEEEKSHAQDSGWLQNK